MTVLADLIDERHEKQAQDVFADLREHYRGSGIKYAVPGQVEGLIQFQLSLVLALCERVSSLESMQKNFRYCGVWKSGREYKRGNFCSHAGALWHCDEDTTETPGKGGNSWTMATKGR